MANVVISLILCLISYIIGYKVGYHDCFKYLKNKLEEFKNGKK